MTGPQVHRINIRVSTFTDNTTVSGLIWDGDKYAYRQEVDKLVLWYSQHNLDSKDCGDGGEV